MAAGNYSGTQAERDHYDRLLAVERKHITVVPDGEREEIRQIFGGKGLLGPQPGGNLVHVITADELRWAKTMVTEEYGLAPTPGVPGIGGALHVCCVRLVRLGSAGDLSRGRRARTMRYRNRRGLLRDRSCQEPLVSDEAAAIGILEHSAFGIGRRRAGLSGRFRPPNALPFDLRAEGDQRVFGASRDDRSASFHFPFSSIRRHVVGQSSDPHSWE